VPPSANLNSGQRIYAECIVSYQIPIYIKDAIDAHRPALTAAVDEAVRLSFDEAREECRRAPGVDKVLQFFIRGVGEIERQFNTILEPERVSVSIASIFTHQTPYVRFRTRAAGNSRCEMTDLCILASYDITLHDPSGGLGNALLLQAKERFDAPFADRQRQLYEVAHHFQYDRPLALREILPDQRHLPGKGKDALSYWEFTQPHTSLRWSHNPGVRVNFGEAIIDFLAGGSGYGFRAPHPNEKSWSRIIFDLLTVTAQACANRYNLKVRNQERGAGAIYRELYNAMGLGAATPFVVRNSLEKILRRYSPLLAAIGREIEANPAIPKEKIDRIIGEKSGSGKEPPILGNNRDFDGDGNGGAGNFILIQFSRRRYP
jgi:hypothetical protein